MQRKIWIRQEPSRPVRVLLGLACVAAVLGIWFVFTTADRPENRIVSRNVLPNPVEIVQAFPSLIRGASGPDAFVWNKSLFFAISISLSRELLAFGVVLLVALPLGALMSVSRRTHALIYPLLVVGSFIPIAGLIPLTQAIFGIEELQKVVFLSIGMFFVLLGLVIKEMDEVDEIYLQTAYTLGFSQLKTVLLVVFPTALPRIFKHLSSVFGLGWGYIIFAEMINSGGGETISGIGWLFLARQRRMQIADMYAIFFVIILFAFLFSFVFKTAGRLLFRHERDL